MVRPYSGKGEDMDTGYLLGLSAEVPMEIPPERLDELRRVAGARPAVRPVGGYHDALSELAAHYQTVLKEQGDWQVLPRTVWDFASGRYAVDGDDRLHYRIGSRWHPIETVIFDGDSREPVFA